MCAKSLWCTYLRLLSALLLAVAVTSCARFALRQQRPEYRLLLDVPWSKVFLVYTNINFNFILYYFHLSTTVNILTKALPKINDLQGAT
jgi:hypothetical protein